MNNLMLTWGLKYLSLGFSIIPVKPRSKEPLIEWKEFQSRRATEAELRSWLQKWPEMNLGIVTGTISSLAVVDLDGAGGIRNGIIRHIVSSVVSLTGNGKQVFYKWQPGIKNSASKIAPGVDVRGEGGFCVVPPSIHPTMKMYRWERFVPGRIPDFPAEILSATFTEKAIEIYKSEDWLSEALEEMKNGHVHNTLVSVLGKFRAHNFSIGDTRRLLEPHALVDGKPFEGLEEKIREFWGRYEPRPYLSNMPGSVSLNDRSLGTLSIKTPTNPDDFEQFQLHNAQLELSTSKLLSGFTTLDRYLEGGLKSERLFTVAARTGTGKTNFAIALAASLCKQGKKVLFFSTEFRYDKIWARYQPYLTQGLEEFRGHALHVCDSFSPRIEQVEETIKKVMPDVFIFDHINHIGEERESLGTFMQGCNFLQRKYQSQGIMVAQLNRQADWVENGKRIEPRMSMVKGSGTIEQASSRVLLLSETRVSPEFNEIVGVLDKNDSGDRGLIQFALYKNPYIFRELT